MVALGADDIGGLGGGDRVGGVVLEGPGAHEADAARQTIAARLGDQVPTGDGRAHVVDAQVQGGDRLIGLQSDPDRQTADVIQQGRDQPARQDAGLGISDQVVAIRNPQTNPVAVEPLIQEPQGVGVGRARGELRQQGGQELIRHQDVLWLGAVCGRSDRRSARLWWRAP
ncbi:hypothetical protein D3C75_933430 [compost metagenome]